MIKELGQIKPGSRIRASDQNEVRSVLNVVQRNVSPVSIGGQPSSASNSGLVVMANNVGTTDMKPCQLAIILSDSPLSQNDYGQRCHTISIDVPISGDDPNRLCILVDPISSGGVGRVLIQGVWWVDYVIPVGVSGQYGTFTPDSGVMTVAVNGPLQIIQWGIHSRALVRLGGGAAGSGVGTTGGDLWKAKITSVVSGDPTLYGVAVYDWDTESTVVATYGGIKTFPPLPFDLTVGTWVWLVFNPQDPNKPSVLS